MTDALTRLLAGIPVTLGRDMHLATCDRSVDAGPTGTLACAHCGRARWMHGTRYDTCASFDWVTEDTLTNAQIEAVLSFPGISSGLAEACKIAMLTADVVGAGRLREARQMIAGTIGQAKNRAIAESPGVTDLTPPRKVDKPRPRVIELNPDTGVMPRAVLEECLDAVLVRVRWYERRLYDTPPQTLLALNHLCRKLGKNPADL